MKDAEFDEQGPKGLVVFDVEGVLLPKRRYIPFEATKKLGFLKFLKIMFSGLLYEVGLSSLEAALKRIFQCFEGYTIQKLRYHYEKLPLLPSTVKVFQYLHRNGWRTALISSGLPELFIKELATKLKADYAFGLKLRTVDGRFTGEIGGRVLKKNGKAVVLKEILNREHLPVQDCVLVADDRNNLQMFPYAGLKIGYNPDFMLSAKSDHIVIGKLSAILPIITKSGFEESKPILSRNQILRLTIHVSGFAIPFICTYLLDRHLVTSLIFLVTLFYVMSELARIVGITFPVFTFITTRAAVKLELYEFATAPISYALGIMLSLLIFPSYIGYAAIAILTLGDGFASLFGKKFGKTKYPFNKSKNLEGSVFGFIFAFLAAAFFLDPMRAFVGAITGMLIECLPTPIDDNLIVPLAAGVALTLASI